MRLLHAREFVFKQFLQQRPAYAILSHRWSEHEPSLQDIERGRVNPSTAHNKVYEFANYVSTHLPRLEWVWVDSCCINQESTAELSEGVNCMFEWYRDASVCIAYLSDVEHASDRVTFRRSVWFRRGWTLQELVASTVVLFVTKTWTVIGHKGNADHLGGSFDVGPNLEPLIAEVTGIPHDVLQDFSNSHALSVEQRMHWIEGRETLREEDMFYSLFGIFGVAPGANYGEKKPGARRRMLAAIEQKQRPGGRRSAHSVLPDASATFVPRSDPNFIERQGLLDCIHTQASVKGAWIALVGLGGVGKTQIAIRYLQRVRERDSQIRILWIFAAHPARFDESIREVADQIELPGRQDTKADILQLLQIWLTDSTRRWLIVLDNADDAEFLLAPSPAADAARATKPRIEYIPTCDHGTVIITSRSRDEAYKFVDENSVIEVMPMDVDHARTLLQKKLGLLYNENSATRLAEALDFMPLALSQAASFIKQKRRYTIEKYLTDLEEGRQSRTSLLRQHGTVPKRDREASSSIIQTWQISFEYIHKTRSQAADLLALMSFCDRQAIPEFLLRDVKESEDTSKVGMSGEGDYEETFDDDIQMLENFSFVSPTTDMTKWDMHRLVQDAMQWWLLDHDRVEEMKQKYIERLCRVMPTGDFENWKICQSLLPHVKSAAELEYADRKTSLLWATIMYRTAWYSILVGSLVDAARFAQKSLSIRQALLSPDDLDVLWSKAVLAEVWSNQGRWKEAEELEVKVMETRRTVLGPEHPSTLTSMANLASTYQNQGRWTEAEELGVKVMETRRTVLGPEHPSTLTSMNNLALTYQNQGRWTEAEELGVKVMETGRTVLGPEHPDTLTSMANLASTCRNQGRWAKAEELGVKVMETRRTVLGPEHPDTLSSMNNLALTYQNQGRWTEAEELGLKVMETRRTVLGPEHPDTLTSMNNLASTYRNQGRWAEAEELEVKAMETRRTVLGPEHPDTLISMNNLALTYWNQGRWAEAEELGVKVMEIRRTVLGPEHPITLDSMLNLAATYYNQERLQEAFGLAKGCLLLRTAVLSAAHPDTKTSVEWVEMIKHQMEAVDSDQARTTMADLKSNEDDDG